MPAGQSGSKQFTATRFEEDLYDVGSHSGFTLTRNDSNQLVKSATGLLAERLQLQCSKQKEFKTTISRFKIAEILESKKTGESFCFVMPYYKADTATQFTDRAAPKRIRTFLSSLVGFVESLFEGSKISNISRELILNKSNQTIELLKRRSGISRELIELTSSHINDIQNLPPQISVPTGPCHGDLTLANILFERESDNYILIDFLDCYFESPVHDLTKLLQEIKLGWTSLLAFERGVAHDRTKYRLIMDELSGLLGEQINDAPVDKDILRVFEFQNILRILPYSAEQKITSEIISCLNKIQKIEA